MFAGEGMCVSVVVCTRREMRAMVSVVAGFHGYDMTLRSFFFVASSSSSS